MVQCDYCNLEVEHPAINSLIVCCLECLNASWDTGVLVDFVDACHESLPNNRKDGLSVTDVHYTRESKE